MGEELHRAWAPLCPDKEPNDTDMDYCADSAETRAESGQLEGGSADGKSVPGPYGLPYQVWGRQRRGDGQHARQIGRTARGGPLAATSTHHELCEIHLEGARRKDAARPPRQAKKMRPIAFLQTSARLLAASISRHLSDYSARVVYSQQQGFSHGRSILDNKIELGGALHSMSAGILPGGFLLDFANVSPSILNRWSLGVRVEWIFMLFAYYDQRVVHKIVEHQFCATVRHLLPSASRAS